MATKHDSRAQKSVRWRIRDSPPEFDPAVHGHFAVRENYPCPPRSVVGSSRGARRAPLPKHACNCGQRGGCDGWRLEVWLTRFAGARLCPTLTASLPHSVTKRDRRARDYQGREIGLECCVAVPDLERSCMAVYRIDARGAMEPSDRAGVHRCDPETRLRTARDVQHSRGSRNRSAGQRNQPRTVESRPATPVRAMWRCVVRQPASHTCECARGRMRNLCPGMASGFL